MCDLRFTLRDFLEENGIKQVHIAQRSGIPADRLSRILRGERALKAQELLDICKVLGLRPDQLEATNAVCH